MVEKLEMGTRDSGRGSKHTIYLNGVPMSFVKFGSAVEQKGDTHFCAPDGAEVSQIYVLKEAQATGVLQEVPRKDMMRYKTGVYGVDGKLVVVTPEELKQASARKESETRTVRVEPSQAIPTHFVKSRYFIGPQKGCENAFSLIMGGIKGTGSQIAYNGVEGGQMRRCILHFEGAYPVLDVLYLESEVLAFTPFEEKEMVNAAIKDKIGKLLERMSTIPIEPITDTKLSNIEELFLAKAQGIVVKAEAVVQPKEVSNIEELLDVALA